MRAKAIEAGQFFLVPNSSGSAYIGQIAEEFPELASVFCYFFDESDVSDCPSAANIDRLSKRIIAAALVTTELLKRGVWKICDGKGKVPRHELLRAARALRAEGFVGATVNGAHLVPDFLDTHFKRLPLDHWATPHLVVRFLEAAAHNLDG